MSWMIRKRVRVLTKLLKIQRVRKVNSQFKQMVRQIKRQASSHRQNHLTSTSVLKIHLRTVRWQVIMPVLSTNLRCKKHRELLQHQFSNCQCRLVYKAHRLISNQRQISHNQISRAPHRNQFQPSNSNQSWTQALTQSNFRKKVASKAVRVITARHKPQRMSKLQQHLCRKKLHSLTSYGASWTSESQPSKTNMANMVQPWAAKWRKKSNQLSINLSVSW